MKIAFLEVEGWEREVLERELSGHSLVFSDAPIRPETADQFADCEILSPFIYSTLTADILARLANLRFIATRSTGFDHIDMRYCSLHGIAISNVPTYGINTVAEHIFALLLSLTRNIVPSVARTRQGNFILDGLRGKELAGKTMGIVGYGHIGKRVAELARAFNLCVFVSTRHPGKDDKNITFVDLPKLLSFSDIICLCVPLTDETHHLLNRENIGQCKKGSILINASRGAVLETEALVWALDHGIFAGAGLDVLEGECDLKEERELLTDEFLKHCDLKTHFYNLNLLKRDNVIVTPHNAFNSAEALTEILKTTVVNITAFYDGKPINVVNG